MTTSELRNKIISECDNKRYALKNAESELKAAEDFLFNAGSSKARLQLRISIYLKRKTGEEYEDCFRDIKNGNVDQIIEFLKKDILLRKEFLEKKQQEFDEYFSPLFPKQE